jgi:glycine dehydrogenase
VHRAAERKKLTFWIQTETHPQTIAVIATRAEPLGIEIKVGSPAEIAAGLDRQRRGVLLPYPTTGRVRRRLPRADHQGARGGRVGLSWRPTCSRSRC